MGMWIIHCDETASWLALSSPSVAGSECGGGGGVVLDWLISENTSPRRGLAEGVFFVFYVAFVSFFKCDWGMQVLILMDCMIVVFCLSDCNAPLHAETVEFGSKSGALQYIPQWIWAIVWEKSVASAAISFIHYYESSRLQQWSRHHRQSGPYSQPAWGSTRGFTGRGHFRSELIGAQQAREATSRDHVTSWLSLIRVYQLCRFQNQWFQNRNGQ